MKTAESSARGVFVGRARELQSLQTALEDMLSGRGRLTLLVGEPGIGKTRTAAELAAQARRTGAVVLWGGCYDGEWAPPFGPFTEAIAAYARHTNADTLRDDLGLGAAPIARVVPAVRERLPDAPEPAPLQPDEERFRLLDAVSQFLIATAARVPVVLVLDDLHWADKGSIAMLRHVARFAPQHRLLLLGTYRNVELEPQHPLTAALGALYRETTCERIALKGLDAPEVAQLIAESDVAPNRQGALATTISAVTNGNPFFVREVLHHLLEAGQLGRSEADSLNADTIGIPDSVRQVLSLRVRRLAAETGRLLSVGAAFGGPFHLAVAGQVAGLDEATALDAIDDALRAQLLRPAESAERYDFTHALIRETLYRELSPSRQARVHRQLAEAMEERYAARVGEHAAEIAHQYYRSRDLPGAESGVTHALTAAERAEAVYAHDEVVVFLRMALQLLAQHDGRRARLLGQLGMALSWALHFDEARQVAGEAGDLIARAEGNGAAADYLAEATMALWEAGSDSGAWDLASHGLRYIGDRRDLTWVQLMAHDIIRREAEDASNPGILIDTPERREVAAVVEALPLPHSDYLSVLGMHGFIAGKSRQDILERLPDNAFFLMCGAGEYRRSLRLIEQRSALCEREGRILHAVECSALLARGHNALGALGAARMAYDHGVELAQRLPGPSNHIEILALSRVEMRMVLDDGWDEFVREYAADRPQLGLESSWGAAATRAGTAWFLARMGQADTALLFLQSILEPLERAPGWAVTYELILFSAATTLWLLQRTDHIEAIERNLREKILAPDFRYPVVDARLSLAHLCALQGRHDEAIEWFAQARAVLDEQGARPLRAIADFDEALMYHRRGSAGDGERARPLLETAVSQFQAIGMPGWIRRGESLLRDGKEWTPQAQAETPPRPSQPPSRPLLGNQGGEPPRVAATPPMTAAAADDASVFRQEGEFWTLAYRGQTARLRDTKGLHYIARLLAQPGRDLHVRDLATMNQRSDPGNGTGSMGVEGDLGTILDARATAQYKERLAEARQELEEATAAGDLGHVARARHEIETITEQLAAAYGLGGRPRTAGDPAERVRKAVTNQIRRALDRISAAHPELGRHLTYALRTGVVCAYRPEHPVAWRL